MVVIKPIRDDNAYFGLALETTPGTPVAPHIFPRWQDGSSLEFALKAEDIYEGDGSRRLSQVVKNQQKVTIKLSVLPRVNELAFFEKLAMGSLSDQIQTTTPTTTLSNSPTAGATSVQVASNTGLTGSGTIQMLLSPGTPNQETATFSLPATGSSTPYTLTVANAGTLQNAHSSGDTIASVAAVNTSVSAAATAGGTSVTLASNVGLTGASPVPVVLSAGTANEEVVSLNCPGTGSAGSYVYSLANSATLKKNHAIGDACYSSVIHQLQDANLDGDYATIEVGLGSLYGQAGLTLRIRSCKLDSIKRSGKAGSVIMYEMQFTGIACSLQVTPATITLEPHPIFLYTQGTWNLDGSTTGDALNIEQFAIDQKNALDETQTEQLTLAALTFGNIAVDVSVDVVYVNGGRIQSIYLGGGTTDSQVVALGSFSVTFTQPDNFQSVTFTVTTIAYTKTTMPMPKKDGKHSVLALSAAATSNQGANAYLIQVSVSNMQVSPN